MRPVLLTAALYSPIGIIPALPHNGVYLHELLRAGYVYLLAVYVVSTVWYARLADSRWIVPTVRFASAAALIGALGSGIVTMLARVLGIEQAYPSESAMRFTIMECYGCEAPWDAAVRVIWYEMRWVAAAAALAPLVGAIGRALRRTKRAAANP